jgi:hypothetical protein
MTTSTHTQESITELYRSTCAATDKEFEVMVGAAIQNSIDYCQGENLELEDDLVFLPMYGASLEGSIEEWKMDQELNA